jgi:chromosome segregation ATPase
VIYLKYKNYTRSPQYGKIYSYNEAGKQVHELDILELELEHDGVEYTVGKLLETVTTHSAEVKELQTDLRAQSASIVELDRTITQLKDHNLILVNALKKLTSEVAKIKSSNTGV